MFVHCQCHVTGHKSEQRHSPLRFAGFHNQSPPLTMVDEKTRQNRARGDTVNDFAQNLAQVWGLVSE